jgi:hypothetical protein
MNYVAAGFAAAFVALFVIVNSIITTLFVRRYGVNWKEFILVWCCIVIIIQIITFCIGTYLPMGEEGVPFLFLIITPIVAGTYILKNIINRKKIIEANENINFMQAFGIVATAQVGTWLTLIWFLPKYH